MRLGSAFVCAQTLLPLINSDLSIGKNPVKGVFKCVLAQSRKSFLDSVTKGRSNSLEPLWSNLKRNYANGAKVKPRLGIADAVACLSALHKMAEESQAKLFLISGTLLGCVREGRVLGHDYDIDIGLHIDDPKLPAFLDLIRRHPDFAVYKAWSITNEVAAFNDWATPYTGKPWIIKYTYKGNIRVDLFIHIPRNNEILHGSIRNLWSNSTFDLRPASFYGMDFWAPADHDRYLTENYGDWRTPVTKFRCVSDTPNARPIHTAAAMKFLMKNYLVLNRLQETKRKSIVLQRIAQTFL